MSFWLNCKQEGMQAWRRKLKNSTVCGGIGHEEKEGCMFKSGCFSLSDMVEIFLQEQTETLSFLPHYVIVTESEQQCRVSYAAQTLSFPFTPLTCNRRLSVFSNRI